MGLQVGRTLVLPKLETAGPGVCKELRQPGVPRVHLFGWDHFLLRLQPQGIKHGAHRFGLCMKPSLGGNNGNQEFLIWEEGKRPSCSRDSKRLCVCVCVRACVRACARVYHSQCLRVCVRTCMHTSVCVRSR